MSLLYFPSCKFTAQYPEVSKRIKAYLSDRHGAEIAGCCKQSLASVGAGDVIVYICNTCAALIRESSCAGKVISLWELLLSDQDFKVRQYADKRMTVQDCWRTYDNRGLQDAVRKLLQNMNIEVVEIDNHHEKADFCGVSLYKALPEHYEIWAPKRFVEDAGDFFVPRPEGEQELLMREHCANIDTAEVLCYCVACVNGINTGGKSGVHLAELVMQPFL